MKKILALLLALVMAMSFIACSSTDEEKEKENEETNNETKKIVMGTSADYPPYEFHIIQDGEDKIVGIDVSLAQQIADDMGAELEIVEMNFDNLIQLMNQGNCDMVLAAIEPTEERLANASCSDPYYTDLPAMILVKKENLDQYQSLDDFAGKVVGAQSGTTKADIITEQMPDATPNLMTSVVDLVNNLVYDKCDALVLDGAVAMQYAESNDELAVVEAISLGEALPYCVWVAKDDPKGILDQINETVAKVPSDGSMEKWIEEAEELSAEAIG